MNNKIDSRTKKLIDATVRTSADPFAVKSIAVTYDYGPYDTEWLMITVVLDVAADAFRWDVRWPMLRALSDALHGIDDTRNPYLDFEFTRATDTAKAPAHA